MKNLQIVFFLIFACILSTQAIRHLHNYVFAYEQSMLAPIEEFFEMKQEIKQETSTEELLEEYKLVEEEIRQLSKSGKDESDTAMSQYELRQQEPELYVRHKALREELWNRERMSNALRDLWVYSIAGLLLIALGSLIYVKGNGWIGMSLIIPGFLELIWWSAPKFNLGGAMQEYQLLLVNKMVLTAIALLLLFALWSIAWRRWKI